MIISEKQIMQLMELARQFQAILITSGNEKAAIQYNFADKLLNNIANQQSRELKEVE